MKKQCAYDRYGNYIINRGQSLGSGTFGKVYRGYCIVSENSFGNYERLRLQPVAIKESFCQASNYQQINILKILNHPNIIKYIDYKVHGTSLFMIMELCEQGTLQDLLMELPEDQTLNQLLLLYYGQVVSGIKFMYEKNILHRDIKPSNILIKDNTVKIADFGTSKLNQEKQLRTLVGTPLFSSPELLEIAQPAEDEINAPVKSTYTQKSDIWSLGLVLYMMFNYQKSYDQQGQRLRKSLPWSGRHAGQVLKNIHTQPLVFVNGKVPQNVKKIIQKMLKINPAQRMSFQQLFALEEFQQKSLKTLKLTLSESNLAISKSFLADSSIEDDFCLNHTKEQQQCIAQEVQKKQIDWQLLKLLQIKDSQHYEDDQIKQALEFYTILLDELREVKMQGSLEDQELIFLFEKKIYQLQSWRLWNIDYQKKLSMEDSVMRITSPKEENKSGNTIMKIDQEFISQVLDQIQGHYSMVQNRINQLKSTLNQQKFTKLIEKPSTQELISKQKIIINFMKPDASLLTAIKQYIKRSFTQELTSTFLNKTIKCNMNLTPQLITKRKKICFIYDLLIAIEFEYSWKLKGQLSGTYGKKYNLGYMKDSFFETYRAMRQGVNIKQIIKRINEAYVYLKIGSVKEKQES